MALSVATLATYLLTTHVLAQVHSLSRADDLLGGMWAVIATLFVFRDTYGQSVTVAVSRMAATSVSLVLCLVYLLILPFHAWGLGVLVGLGALVMTFLGRPGDTITTGIAGSRDGRRRSQPARCLATTDPALDRHHYRDGSRRRSGVDRSGSYS
jgi:hypothetical protein